VLRNAYPKASREAQSKVPGAKLVPLTDGIYWKKEDRPLLGMEPKTMTKGEADRRMKQTYYQRYFGLIGMHATMLVSRNRVGMASVAQPARV
jgi:hypothetical protein